MKPSRQKRLESWKKIREAVCAGMPMRDAAEAFNVGLSAIFMRSVREKWNVKEVRAGKQDVLLAAIEANSVDVGTGVQEHRVNMLTLSMRSRRALATAIQKGMAHLSKLPEAELVKEHKALASFSSAAEALFGWKALAIVEGEAAVKTVREESGQRDTRAVNLELIRTTPKQLRQLALAKKACEARAAEGRVVEEATSGTAPEAVEPALEPEPTTVRHAEANENPDRVDAARREQRPWWEAARAQKLSRKSALGKEGSVAISVSNQSVVRGMSELEVARAQHREESRQNLGRGRR